MIGQDEDVYMMMKRRRRVEKGKGISRRYGPTPDGIVSWALLDCVWVSIYDIIIDHHDKTLMKDG